MAGLRPETCVSVWHPLNSDPALAGGLNWLTHLLALLAALLLTLVFGVAIWGLGAALVPLSEDMGGAVAALGLVLSFSVLFSWCGHLPGALVLHVLIKKGRCGWASAMLAGAIVGLLLAGLIGGVLAIVLGPVLALLHSVALRVLAGVSVRRGAIARTK